MDFDFRLLQRCWWDLHLSGVLRSVEWQSFTNVSGQRICPVFKGKMVLIHCCETSVKVYHSTLHNSPHERRSEYRLVQNLPTSPAFKTSISHQSGLPKACIMVTAWKESGYVTGNCNKGSLVASCVWVAATNNVQLVWVHHSGYLIFFLWCNSPYWARASSFLMLRSSDQPDAETSTWQHTTLTTSIPQAGFKSAIPAIERPDPCLRRCGGDHIYCFKISNDTCHTIISSIWTESFHFYCCRHMCNIIQQESW
jgi:hypothetical protein